jgi:hypothetical protein
MFGHRPIERRAVFGMLGAELPYILAIQILKCVLAGLDTVQQMALACQKYGLPTTSAHAPIDVAESERKQSPMGVSANVRPSFS